MSNKQTNRGSLFIIAAPSGGGKTSLVNALLEQDPRLVISVSHTTRAPRPPRPGESNGEHYHFVSEKEYRQMVDDGDFMEHAVVFDHYYGTNRNAVAAQLDQDRDVILEIDWQGARQVKSAFVDCCSIFIIPPSLEILRKRLTRRGQDSEKIIQRRMRDARAEISHWAEFDFLVVNDKFDAALEELLAIINDFRHQSSHEVNKNYQHLAQQLGKS
jgi:guanylate kinase